MRFPLRGVLLCVGLGAAASPAPAQQPPSSRAADTVPVFRHSEHERLECRACHEMDRTHGARLVQSLQDCRSCHHTERAGMDCVSCHPPAEIAEETYPLSRTFDLTVLDEPSRRDLAFRHEVHEDLACADCHDDGPSLAVPELDCQGCHEDHHAPDAAVGCFQCHVDPGEDAHDMSVHVTCSGAGCHQEVPTGTAPRTRPGCLWCHQDMTDHKAGRDCVICHLMPAPHPGDGRDGPP